MLQLACVNSRRRRDGGRVMGSGPNLWLSGTPGSVSAKHRGSRVLLGLYCLV